MARYFFDIYDGEDSPDAVGVELLDLEAARTQATLALAEIARDELPGDGPERELTILIRDESGRVLMRTSLVFSSEMADKPATQSSNPSAILQEPGASRLLSEGFFQLSR